MSNTSQAVSTDDIAGQIKLIAADAFDNGLSVKIDRNIPSVSIQNDADPDDGYFFQGSEADGILHEVDEQAGFYGVTAEEYFAFVSQTRGMDC